jgi:hypothetical protein
LRNTAAAKTLGLKLLQDSADLSIGSREAGGVSCFGVHWHIRH